MSLFVIPSPSPSHNERAPGKTPRYVILHYTGMPEGEGARERLCDPAAEVSAHYLIERNGQIWQLVPEERRAWHAGIASWQGEQDMNSLSIGVELANRGHRHGYQPYPTEQIDACIALLHEICARHPGIAPQNLLAPSDIAPQRKEDPGELFPWQILAAQGLGLWPDTLSPAPSEPMAYTEARALLRRIGYDCPAEGEYDPGLRRILLAFQRHWLPAHLSGLADARTVPVLQAVAAAAGGQ